MSFLDENVARAIRDRFDRLAVDREYWQKKNRNYYDDQQRFYRFLVPQGLHVLELGCGLGDLLAAVQPKRGLGLDLSEGMAKEARRRHPHLEFRVADVETIELEEKFDVIILADVIGHLLDVETVLRRLHQCCTSRTRLIISYYNFLWEPILRVCEWLGLKMPQQQQNWLAPADIMNLLHLTGYEVVKSERRLLLPIGIPFISALVNRMFAILPGIRTMCLCHYVVARPLYPVNKKKYSTTIVIPCRNERGNIEDAISRIPCFGDHQEIIFVDGNSTDGTQEEIRRVIQHYPLRDIRLLVQDGKGKADAVRKGFAHANGEILLILDADLTMPPEELPKFYEAISSGKGEFINGSRLVYPMETKAMQALNVLGNKFFSLAFSWLINQRIKDTLCGTKVLSREDYSCIERNRHYFGDFDPFGDFDLLFGASKLNLKILEVPIRYRQRRYGSTNIRRFLHGWLLLKMTIYAFFKLKAV